MVLLRVCVTPVHAAQSLVGCARSHLRREQPGGDANRGKNKGFSCEKERVCAALFYLSRIRFGTADGRGKNLDRRRSVRLTLFCRLWAQYSDNSRTRPRGSTHLGIKFFKGRAKDKERASMERRTCCGSKERFGSTTGSTGIVIKGIDWSVRPKVINTERISHDRRAKCEMA